MRRAAPAALALFLLSPGSLSSQWTQGTAGIWIKSALFVQVTDKRYDPVGNRVPWIDGGESDARALYTDVIVGLTPRMDIWLQLPFFDLRFKRAAGDLRTTGFGDIRLWGRYQVARLADGRLPLAIRAGVKAPVGSSPLDAEIIPVGEGQWDLEGFAEGGYSFWPAPLYAVLWLGYRARLANDTQQKNPGGEWVLLAEGGATPGNRILLKATLDGFRGRSWVIERLSVPGAARRTLTLQLGGGFRVSGGLWAEGGVRLPLLGRNFPAGKQWVLGVSAQAVGR